MSNRQWGKVLIATRLGKQVPAEFVVRWTEIASRIEPGDGCTMVRGMVAHKAANHAVRQFLKTDCDSILFIDDDCIAPADIVRQFQELPGATLYDVMQAFYTRRGWPPTPIWIRRDELGNYVDTLVEDDQLTERVGIVGLHCCMIRRRVFEELLGDGDPETHEWFFYPRHQQTSEDGAFSIEAAEAGFKLGATTRIKTDHISELATGWGIYNDWLNFTGRRKLIIRYRELAKMIAQHEGVTADYAIARSMRAGLDIADQWRDITPVTVRDYDVFYQTVGTDYLYDLLRWNCEPLYERIIVPLRDHDGARCLVIGAGIGTEIDTLLSTGFGNRVDYLEPSTPLANFLAWRFSDDLRDERDLFRVSWADLEAHDGERYDVISCVDTLEHIHQEEISKRLSLISSLIEPGGLMVMNYTPQRGDDFPQHVDNDRAVAEWLERDFKRVGFSSYIRNS